MKDEVVRETYLSDMDKVVYQLAEKRQMTLDEACAAILILLTEKAKASHNDHINARS